MIVAQWAQRYSRPIAGALLATPPDLGAPLPSPYPSLETFAANGWLPVPRVRLPFPSIVAASRNDPIGDFDRVSAIAADWGSTLHDAGHVGHLNGASGFGEWPQAVDLLQSLGAPSSALQRIAA
jgi:predicted alpha/beta hydrolase family esterase